VIDGPADATWDRDGTQLALIIVAPIDPDRILKIIVPLVDGPTDASSLHCDIIPVFKTINSWLRMYKAQTHQ